jgi:hypothetical protein
MKDEEREGGPGLGDWGILDFRFWILDWGNGSGVFGKWEGFK